MARFVKCAILTVLLAFFVNSAMSDAQEFIGPRYFAGSEKSVDSQTSGTTAIALKDKDISYFTAKARDDEAKARKELLDDIETMNAYMKLVAEEFENDGVVVVRAVKTINVADPPAKTKTNHRDNDEASATSAELKKKSSRSTNFITSAKVSPFKKAMQDKCDKEEAIFQNLDVLN